jgi:uncharacterized protein YecE (DUF72 family)
MSEVRKILIGTAGFQYPDWKGVVYPADVKKKYGHELTYLAQFFDCCDINTSFYGPLKIQSAAKWCEYVSSVNPDFQFTAKLTQVFTHAPNAKTTSSSVETIRYTQADVDEAKAGFEPLMNAGRLGAVIAQFPISFKFRERGEESDPLYGNWDHVLDVMTLFKNYPLAIEFRDASWNDKWVLSELQNREVAFCNVDQPRLGNSLDGTQHVTAPFAYIRLHDVEMPNRNGFDLACIFRRSSWNKSTSSSLPYAMADLFSSGRLANGGLPL